MSSGRRCAAAAIPRPKRICASAAPRFSRLRRGTPPLTSPAIGCCDPANPIRSTAGLIAFTRKGSPASRSDRDAGVSPLFPPPTAPLQAAPEAKERFLNLLRRDPRTVGIDCTRWRLADLLAACDWLGPLTPSGLCRMFARLGISYQRGRAYVHSPDPHYEAKRHYAQGLIQQARHAEGRIVTLLLDELTYYRQPTLAPAYEARGQAQPLARHSYTKNTPTRVAATLSVTDAQVCYRQGCEFGIAELVRFYRQVRAAYPEADQIYVIQDNWPVHFHPDVLVALEEQQCPWPFYQPPSWPQEPSPAAVRRWGEWQLPIQVVPLPTYASWLNPIEKLWRKAKQEVLHLHRWADRLDELRLAFTRFLDQFAHGSQELLRYVGLVLPD
jgi:hypothetical protein